MTASGVGSGIDTTGVLQAAYDKVAWKHYTFNADNHVVNKGIAGLEVRVLDASVRHSLDPDNRTTIFAMNCFGHSAVLATRSAAEHHKPLTSTNVRMGHQMESGRTLNLWTKADAMSLEAISDYSSGMHCLIRCIPGEGNASES